MPNMKYIAAAALSLALTVPVLAPAQARTWHHRWHHARVYHHHYYHHHHYRGARYYRNYSNRNEFACTLPRSSQSYVPCMNHW